MGLKAISRLIRGSADYEEGSWTPTLGVVSGTDGSHSYGQQFGAFVRVGNLVWVTGSVTINGTPDAAMSGSLTIKGLPFVNGQSGAGVTLSVSGAGQINLDTAGGYSVVVATIRAGASDIALRENGDSVAFANLTEADALANMTIVITGAYQTTPSGS